MTKKIVEEIQNLLVRKRVNILIGSGASLPAINLMSSYKKSSIEDEYDVDRLISDIKEVSRVIIDESSGNDNSRYENNCSVLDQYRRLVSNLLEILEKSNSRNSPKNINVFTTNYDLFIEKAVEDNIHKKPNFIFNDGANGYFDRKLDSFNFDRSFSYKNQFEGMLVVEELPSICLLKPHGSVNWEMGAKDEESSIFIRNSVVENPVVVPPDGHENENTYSKDHYYEMLRLFQVELSKPESILLVIGFSFGDKHIAKMVQRALSNPQILVYVFSYDNHSKKTIQGNLKVPLGVNNLKILGPEDLLDNPTVNDGLDLERLNNVIFKFGG